MGVTAIAREKRTLFGRLSLGYGALVAGIAAVAALALVIGEISPASYFSLRGEANRFWIWATPVIVWYAALTLKIARRRLPDPLSVVWRMTRMHRHWLGRALLVLYLSIPLISATTAIKRAIPRLNPYFADAWLVEADRALLFGHDAWQITHTVIGPLGTAAFDRLYVAWFVLTPVMLAWFAFTSDTRFQLRGMIALSLVAAVLGNFVAIAGASVGPCFYHLYFPDSPFAPLFAQLDSADALYGVKALTIMSYLEGLRGQEVFGSGISALPSLHVGIAFLFVLVCRERCAGRWPGRLAGAYFAAIAVGSVHLGWHYASDGIVAVAGTALIWRASAVFVAWIETRTHRRGAASPPAAVREPLALG